jgi:2-hydroxy-6-oxonona-2,4-dienedioate hydrolase
MTWALSGRLESRWAAVRGWRMHYRRSLLRAGPASWPVVLVHGLSVSSRYMLPLAHNLAADHEVYAIDFPGFGKSEDPRRSLSVPELAGVLEAWMGLAGLRRALLVGNSAGCQVIAHLAARFPERVSAAVLTGPTIDAERRTAWQQFIRLMLDGLREPPLLNAIIARDYLAAGLRRTLATLRHVLADAIEHNLPRMQAPTLVVRGNRDPLCPQRWAETVAGLLPRSALAVLPGAHGVHFTEAGRLADLVREVNRFR